MRTARKRQDSPDHVRQKYRHQQVGQPIEESLKLEMMEEGNYNPQLSGKVVDWLMWKERLQNEQSRIKGSPLQLYTDK